MSILRKNQLAVSTKYLFKQLIINSMNVKSLEISQIFLLKQCQVYNLVHLLEYLDVLVH